MKLKTEHLLLLLIFLGSIGFRLYFSSNTETFKNDDSYFHLRQIQNIIDDKKVLKYDPLSYGGRVVLYPPFFHIIMALLSLGQIFYLKVINEILISTIIIFVYLIAKELSGNTYSALFSSLLSAFLPGLITETLSQLTVYSLALPLLFLSLYLYLKLENRKLLWAFIISILLLALTHPTVFIFLLTLLFYFLITAGGAINASRIEKEATVFSLVAVILFT